jgi:hypothetical protein
MKPTAPLRCAVSVFATTPCRGLSLSRYAFEVVHIHIPLRETKRKQSAPPKTSSLGETQWEITDATGHRPRHYQPN